MFSSRRIWVGSGTIGARRRRVAAATGIFLALAFTAALARQIDLGAEPAAPDPSSAKLIGIYVGERLSMQIRLPPPDRPPDIVALRLALTARLTPGNVVARGNARIRYVYDIEATTRRLLASNSRRVQAVRRAVSSRIVAPVVRQFARNACEAAALHSLLATTGVSVSQQRLQAGFARSGPVDPIGSGVQRIWGDPDRGYVGRPDGGGAAGGFGIYPTPVAATARRHGRRLDDLTASKPADIYARLLAGQAVMAWIGLSDGPYAEWRSPQGRRIKVNFGEHTIVLTGMDRQGNLRVVDPLTGTLQTWSRQRFEAAWRLLGRRALGATA